VQRLRYRLKWPQWQTRSLCDSRLVAEDMIAVRIGSDLRMAVFGVRPWWT